MTVHDYSGEVVLELQDYWRVARQNWIMILVITLVTTGAGSAYAFTRTPLYRATTELYVSAVPDEKDTMEDLTQWDSYVRSTVSAYAGVVAKSTVAQRVSEEMGGVPSPVSMEKKLSGSASDGGARILISATDADPEVAAEIADIAGGIFASMVTEELDMSGAGTGRGALVEIVQEARPPKAPMSSDTRRIMILSMLAGLALGVAIAILREVLDTRVRSSRGLAALTAVPVLGQIPADSDAGTDQLVVSRAPTGPTAEAFRIFSANLQYLSVEDDPRSLVMASAGPSEGTSVTAANLAIALADSGYTVCLVDGNLRKPRLAELFSLKGAKGLTDIIIGKSELDAAVQPSGTKRLSVLPAGHSAPNPSELLASKEMASIVTALEGGYDYVIVDAPPVLTVMDAATITKHAGGILLVVAAGQSKKDNVTAATDRLQKLDTCLLGIVLTKIPEKTFDEENYAADYFQEKQ